MENVSLTKESRRDFLKNASKTSVAVAVGGIALAGCGSDIPREKNGVKTGSSKKKEILYRSTKYWSSYYASAK
ncbi:twin-arginine translocation signal domain-containing protein [Helicobacter kayseriensis]|uniref:twin-arginine translocation signal domain-containing protein n=1 Tax=Helicobacter kayseriensis TaxID=2905877 RepID=UPI001E348708|nr:twin-arginine translocation signal domain-containing protein [Helicobacter kayseriensis]MCE3047524.1 twin-arginine translocation signal domain-containing protein [Helicobacter kayseriensis]MCE3048846.1 twin-arginine translocation signal domain-containing protein [Helicobacter kayseriensis]